MKWCIQEKESLVLARDNPFLSQLIYSFQTPQQTVLVLRYERNGSLKDVLNANRADFNCIVFFLASLAVAVDRLHSLKIIHRDLKARNVLIGNDGHIVLADFGCSIFFDRSRKIREQAGTLSHQVSST